MNKDLALLLSYVSVFTLGLYAASQFKFHTPIEPYRWIVTSLCWGIFATIAIVKYKENE